MSSPNRSSADTKDQILDAADEFFGTLGFTATSTRLIAERSGVNKALIHYHFGSKQQLFTNVLDRYYARLEETVRTHLGQGDNARERLLHLIDSYVDFLAENHLFSRMIQREILGGQHVERITQIMLPMFQLGRAVVQSTYPETKTGPLEASQLLVSIYGMVVASFSYAPVLEGLWGEDPLAPPALERRKAHLRAMAELVMQRLEH